MASKKEDSSLGLDQGITRRDFLNASMLGAGSALLYTAAPGVGAATSDYSQEGYLGRSWYGYGGVGDFEPSHGNTPELVNTAHKVRDGSYALIRDMPVTEEYDLVIVGGGMAGLGAAWHFKKHSKPKQHCLILDNHPLFGGESKENEFNVGGTSLIAPQGANGFFMPPHTDDPESVSGDARYYAEFNIPRELPYQSWPEDKQTLGFCKDNYGFTYWRTQDDISVGHYFEEPDSDKGKWYKDIWSNRLADAPLSDQDRRHLLGWRDSRLMDVPEDIKKYLDTISYKDYLKNKLELSNTGADYASDFLASAFGLGSDAVSAYVAYLTQMPGLITEQQYQQSMPERNSFPGGNSGFARYFLKGIVPGAITGSEKFEDVVTGRINFTALDQPNEAIRVRLNTTAIAVEHEGKPDNAGSVKITYSKDGELRAIRAKAVVMASGGWINRHVVRDMPDSIRSAYQSFVHAPMLVANVALTNWRFLYRLGITGCRWQGGFGSSCNIRQPMRVGRHQPPLDPDKPIVLTFYVNFIQPGLPAAQQSSLGRMQLFSTSYSDYERQIRQQMVKLFGAAGFDPKRDIAGIILNRWGHAYVVPTPGFFFDTKAAEASRNTIMKGYGRIAFGHSELNGFQHWGPAADQGRRAVEQIIDFL